MILADSLKKARRFFPDKKAVVCGGDRWTYGEFYERLSNFSRYLKAEGIEKNDRIAILHPNCHYYLESYYALATIGKEHLRKLPPGEQLRYKSKTGREFIAVELKVVNEAGREIRRDEQETGEIIVRGDTVTPGYWHLPEETEKAIRNGWLYTGDMAVMDSEGYVTIVDRKKDMIVTGGENVYSIEVENTLYQHQAVLECAVVGVPDEKWGEAVHAAVVLKPNTQATQEELIDFCKERIARYKSPKSLKFLAELPKTGSGKIEKKKLRDKHWPDRMKKV